MNYRIILDDSFEREVKHLSKRYPSLKADLGKLREELYANPQLGTDLGGGLRKIRMAITSKGRGKSGGARVIVLSSSLFPYPVSGLDVSRSRSPV